MRSCSWAGETFAHNLCMRSRSRRVSLSSSSLKKSGSGSSAAAQPDAAWYAS